MTRSRLIKLATLRPHVSDLGAMQMTMLGMSGYSWKFICTQVLKKPRSQVSDRDLRELGRVLKRHEIRVTDYRNGENDTGAVLARRIMKRRSVSVRKAAS